MRGSAFWWACVLAAPPIAWLAAASGWGMAVGEPVRDIAFLLLWSTVEEVVFRGFLQPRLAHSSRIARYRPLAGLSLANLITSVLFALAHLWNRTPIVALGVLPISLVLGMSLERSGRLWVPVALHGYFNLLLYAASWPLRVPG